MIKVSVIIAVYNNKEDVLNAINSVINQSYYDWELIIIDDFSTDGTFEILSDFLSKLQNEIKNKIKISRNQINVGTYVSFNEGILKSNGSYIKFLGSDDKLHPKSLEKQVNILDKNNKYVGVLSNYMRDNSVIEKGEATIMFRKEIIKQIGYFDSVRFGADSEFINRINYQFGFDKLYSLKEILYYSKRRKNSLTTNPNTCGIYKNGLGSSIRIKYKQSYTNWHSKNKNLFIPYPIYERPFNVDQIMLP